MCGVYINDLLNLPKLSKIPLDSSLQSYYTTKRPTFNGLCREDITIIDNPEVLLTTSSPDVKSVKLSLIIPEVIMTPDLIRDHANEEKREEQNYTFCQKIKNKNKNKNSNKIKNYKVILGLHLTSTPASLPQKYCSLNC
jgi:hypothetical protein